MPPSRKSKQRKASSSSSFLAKLVNLGLIVALWVGVAGAAVVGYYAYDLPDIREVAQPQRRPSITILAKDGSVIARYGDVYGNRVTLDDVPKNLVYAIISIEDRRFFDHFGVDIFGLLRAALKNTMAGHVVQGGSTLTQQLAKNLFLSPERTMKRKVQEVLLALWLEKTYSKNQILTAYLNRVYLGAGTYGVDAAARTYFDKPVQMLNLRECAIIAGLLRAPSKYAPTNDMAAALARARVVLSAMEDAGYITVEQRDVAMINTSAPPRKPGAGGDGRYFADWVLSQTEGMGQDLAQDLVIQTTLDFNLQRIAERQVNAILASAAGKNVSQAALVTLTMDGAVRAMVGGRDYSESQFNRATQAQRQPGSSFKPVIYLTALQSGMLPNDLMEDAPIKIGRWSPENYEGKYEGMVTLRQALAESINTVAVRLLQKVGLDQTIKTAGNLGFTSSMDKDLSLALGTNAVSPLELTGVYATLASGGRIVTPYAIEEIRTKEGQVLFRRTEARAPILVDAGAVATLTDMMQGVVQFGTGKAAALDRPVAGKTGTTSDYRDAWFVGFTADYTTGVWLGNDDNSSMKKVTGGSFPARLWHDYMREAEADLPVRALLTGGTEIPAPSQDSSSGVLKLPSASDVQDGIGSLIRKVLGN